MKKLALSLLFLFQAIIVMAQNQSTVKGKVVDSKSQAPLGSAKVMIQSSGNFVTTNNLGEFLLNEVQEGSQVLQISVEGYNKQNFTIEVVAGQILDVGMLFLDEDITVEQQLSLVTITENDLGDDSSGSESTSGLLQSSRDAYQQAAAFNWGAARFRIRGLDSEYGTTMINGITMNKLLDGRPQFGNWGGLNDVTRNQEFTLGTAPSDYTFGSILGTQEINTRASLYRKGNRISFSGTNTNYSWRSMATINSGLMENGWAYSVSGGRRWAKEGFFEGTDYAANSLFASVEKRFNDKHSLNLTSIYAQNSRGTNTAITDEVARLKGFRYNPQWGYQNGKKRNSSDRNIEEPMVILSHYWKPSNKTTINTNVAYQTGSTGRNRLEFPGANNPNPTYYQNLPSFFINNPDRLPAGVNPTDYFLQNSQINWDELYLANANSTTGAAAFLTEQRVDDKQLTANSIIFSDLSDNIKLNAGVSFRNLSSRNYTIIEDLLGASYALNADGFNIGPEISQFDLNNPNAQVVEGDVFGYNYKLYANVVDAFTQFKFSYKKTDFYLAQSFSRSEYQREGLYRTGFFPTTSFGKSEKQTFENFGFKGGFTYKISGQHFLDFNGAYMTKAPNLRNTFVNARRSNAITNDLTNEEVSSLDASYILKTPKFKARLTGFMTNIKKATALTFYFAEGLFEDAEGDDDDSLISEILSGVDKRNVGAELGLEYQITSTIKATGAASYGQYIIANNPTISINNDTQATLTNTNPITSFGQAYLKNYRQSGMPQTAASFGLEYRDPKFWWVSANINYLADSYISVANIFRTENFVLDDDGFGYNGASKETVAKALKQERLPDLNLLNLSGGKSWRVDGKTIGFFATINNALDVTYKSGGFEQSRKATFQEQQTDNANGTPSFGNRYFYGYGRTYFVNLYINF
ncbi:carboxypeptidase-like regulatory domain-containing protein [Flavobacterium difficile]|uniref:TonB-dependent receptor n=1 Tax=Flavobacterium difficile TaxID=2709659 RepID=A0ABX0I9B9_9FLAO|nr:carboxypeptidase-like regulatory domain-containing protein [Flavobacterium difficile]NHM02292.1 TonB-dependent receptor [Flavobacterium difficile]